MAIIDINSMSSSLFDLVRVRQSSIRSIHVVQDMNNAGIIDEYLVTRQTRSSLMRILERLYSSSPTRAWTLTGPYGTGKSYFSLVLMNLFCAAQPGHQHALDLLRSIDPILAEQTTRILHLDTNQGFFVVPVAGSRAPLADCMRNGLQTALLPYLETPGVPELLEKLDDWGPHTGSQQIAAWIDGLQTVFSVAHLPFQGMLIILDEMGKLLEFAAANPDQTDVFLFQELAERANRSGDFPIVLIGVLHQAFDRYSSMLNSAIQREWVKVQGRFEDIAFQEPPAIQMQLLSRALENVNFEQSASLTPLLETTAEEAWQSGWQPELISHEQFIELCKSSYPFHPSALVALPYLFKRLGQNERSLFAYLASSEPYGFQDFIHKHSVPEFLRLPYLFDYLVTNFQARLYAATYTRSLTETLERLISTPNLEPLEVDLLKTIGLINWLASSGAIQATEPVVISALRGEGRSEADIRNALNRMKMRSIVVFRRFNSTYNIWQGSDVDIEERLEAASKQLSGTFSFSEIIQRYLPPQPIVAKRHSYKTGTLRFFEIRYVDISNYLHASLEVNPGAAGIVLLALPTNPTDVEIFRAWATRAEMSQQRRVLIGIAERSSRLADLVQELRALHWVNENTPELRGDPVARRELRTRLASIEGLIRTELDASLKLHRLDEAQACSWYWQGEQLLQKERRGLSHLLSDLCDSLYDQSPIIWNELINRRVLSSQAAAARRNLIERMLTTSHQERLGIEGYPPERSMYESLLMKGGMHVQRDGEWTLADLPAEDPLRLRPAWQAIASFIFAPPVQPRPVSELFAHLEAPPYGVTPGVLPVLLCAFLSVNQAETTLYHEGTLLPEPGVADWEVLLRRPELFSIAGCRVEGPLQAVVRRLSRGLRTAPAVMPIVRNLVRGMKALPQHAWRTQRLPQEALAVRHLIETAHSPERLLFHDLPEALGLEPFDEQIPDDATVEEFFNRLNKALEALTNATPRLQEWARDQFLQACALPTGMDGWEQFRSISEELASRVNTTALIPLLNRAVDSRDSQSALESVLAFVANRPIDTWSDRDTDYFVTRATAIGELFLKEQQSFLSVSHLNHQQQKRCQELATKIRDLLNVEFGNDPQLIQSVLQALAKELIQSARSLEEGK